MKLSASITVFAMLMAACGTIEELNVDEGTTSESAGGEIGRGSGSGEIESEDDYSGSYVITEVVANDGYTQYYYTPISGKCGFEMTKTGSMTYSLVEQNDCTLRDDAMDMFDWVDAATSTAELDSFGAVIDIRNAEVSGGSSGEADDVTDFAMMFTEHRCLMEVTKIIQGYEITYTYKYAKI